LTRTNSKTDGKFRFHSHKLNSRHTTTANCVLRTQLIGIHPANVLKYFRFWIRAWNFSNHFRLNTYQPKFNLLFEVTTTSPICSVWSFITTLNSKSSLSFSTTVTNFLFKETW
jgi:hypothetical protein